MYILKNESIAAIFDLKIEILDIYLEMEFKKYFNANSQR